MDVDKWTAAYGWKVVLRKAGVRLAILFVALSALFLLLWDDICVAHFSGGLLALLLIAGVIAGCFVGWAVARKLPEASGLEPRRIFLPVLGGLVLAEFLACLFVAALHSSSVLVLLFPFGAMILWSGVVCAITLLMR